MILPGLEYLRGQDEDGASSLCPPRLPFTEMESDAAAATWRFNCGPAALCALLGVRTEQLRPHLGDFERKGYTNPTLMLATLRTLGVRVRVAGNAGAAPPGPQWPRIGLARIQWGGPWCAPGVPIQARYRQTHWVASLNGGHDGHRVFDVNACAWRAFENWSTVLAPWLIQEAVPRGDGTWWLTHAVEVRP